ncbi:GIN domain-containing protein [Luteibacter yeojuensis]|uniref:DUF4097 family beta strand repeat protein n=1 Tax=Luteibacter yeojuensis TaxID=345309 RepID=A0A7X5QX62_9GAMM|nr:DUF4097 family beta strand repeat-containing protein [Luteibacter yeojuensis]NID17063.1 DUF4097 family beta strand repeat protein [Luteibacter yeojuensis]
MRKTILASLLLLPAAAMADNTQCKFHADRNLDLDLRGVHAVRFVTNSYDLLVSGGASAGKGTVRGKACASDQETVDNLVVTQQRDGDTLVVELKDQREHGWFSGWGNRYADLKVEATIPADVPVKIHVGSGDAKVRNVASLDAAVGSGDLEAHDIKGEVRGTVGSGDFKLEDTGAVEIDSVGSGDFGAKRAARVRIGTVGSGDATVANVQGNVQVGTIGSGDLDVNDVRGDLTVRTVGSGDVHHHGIAGKVDIPRDND